MKKIITIMLAVVLALGMQLGTLTEVNAVPTLEDGTYEAEIQLMKETNHNSESMANGAIEHIGQLEVIDGEWFLTITFKTMVKYGLKGNASDIRYFTNHPDQNSLVAGEVLSTRMAETMSGDTVEKPKDVKIKVPADSEGTYLRVYVDAMGMDVNVYCMYTIPTHHKISVAVEGEGVVNPADSVMVKEGSSKTFEFNPVAGYTVDSVMLDDAEVTGWEDTNSYTIENVTAPHTLKVTFVESSWDVTSIVEGNGTVSPSGTTSVAEGEDIMFEFTPMAGYKTDSVMLDDAEVTGWEDTNSYTIENVTAPHTLKVTFAEITSWDITSSVEGNGTISPLGVTSVNEGEDIMFEITPDLGYKVKDILINGDSVGPDAAPEFKDVMGSYEIKVIFEPIEFEIIEGANQSFEYGSKTIDELVVNADFNLFDGLLIDGQLLINGSDYTAREGSTIVKLSENYLKNLSEGEHKVEFKFKNNTTVKTSLTVTPKKEESKPSETTATTSSASNTSKPTASASGTGQSHSPATGDSSTVYMSLLIISAALAMLISASRRQSSK